MFELSAEAGQAPFIPLITNISENTESFQWDFGDGSATSVVRVPTHTYTEAGTFTISLTAGDGDGSATFIRTITVEAGPVADIQIQPTEATVSVADSLQLSADLRDEFGNQVKGADLVWTAMESAGVIDNSGRFTAATKAAAYEEAVILTATKDGLSRQAVSDLVIAAGPPAKIQLEPSPVLLDIGFQQEISLQVFDEFGNEIPGPLVAWKADHGAGTIDAQGVFTAGTKAGRYPQGIRLEAVEGTSLISATVEVGVRPDPLASIEVGPSFPIVRQSEGLRLTPTGLDQHGNKIANLKFLWNSRNLAVDGSGWVSGGDQEGLYEVTVQASYRDVEQVAVVTVAVPPVLIPVGNMSERRAVHTATLLQNGKVLVAGGDRASRTAELYDPLTRIFETTGSLNISRTQTTATLLPDGRVLFVSGRCTNPNAEFYDPTNGTFSMVNAQMEQGRRVHTATLLEDGKVLVAGGYCPPWPNGLRGTSELYDPLTDTFRATSGQMVKPRAWHAATLLSNGQVLLARGQNAQNPGCVDLVELYDPSTDSFREAGATIQYSGCSNDSGSLAQLPDGRLLFALGTGRFEIYDPATETFELGTQWEQRYSHTATTLQDGRVFITGGHRGETGIHDTSLIYDPVADTIDSEILMTTPRIEPTATLLSDGTVLITGGSMIVDDNVRSPLKSAEILVP